MKVAIIGTGYWGKNLVRVFSQLGVLEIICDSDKKVLRKRKRDFPWLKTTTNFLDVLKKREIDAVVISTPSATHYKLAKLALNSGKDVFVEKPLALKVKEGKELLKLTEKKKKILMVGHLLLYHPAVLKLKEIIKKGELGKICYIWSNRLNFGRLRREENVLWSFAPHDISVILDILGMPKKVRAIGKTYLQKDIPDITLTSLEFQEGKAAHIFVSWLNPFKEQKLSIIGSKAMAVFDGVKNELIIYFHKIRWRKNKNPEVIKAKGKVIKISKKEPLMEEAKHFLKCIKERKDPRTDGKEALEVLKVLEGCQRSLSKNGKLINL